MKGEKKKDHHHQTSMSWDDEDFEIPTTSKTAAAASWEDEEEDPLMESWDVDEEAEAKKKKAEEEKKKAELKKKQDQDKAKKLAAKNKLMELDELDEETRKELLRKAELNADLNNAADLFGGLGVAGDSLDDVNAHPREKMAKPAAKPAFNKNTPINEFPLFQPVNKLEYEKLRKTLGPVLTELAENSPLNYASSLAIDLIRDLVGPLSVENLRKVNSTLAVVLKEKEKEERQARLRKSGGTATGGAGKKKAKPLVKTNVNNSFKKDAFDDMDANYDDFGDDDFM